MEVAEENIPSPAKELLAHVRKALGYEGTELRGYDFSAVGVDPFYGLYPHGSVSPLLSVALKDGSKPSMRLTFSHQLGAKQREDATRKAAELAKTHGYALVP